MSTPTMQQIAALAGLKPVEEAKTGVATPGPWQTDGSRIFHQRNAGGRKLWVAETLQGDDTAQQREANARLVAAAPDLLAACKAALPYLSDSGGTAEPLAHEAVEAAIRKAQSGHATITLFWFVGFASAAFLWMLWSLMKAAI